jgi:hypothetical protein
MKPAVSCSHHHLSPPRHVVRERWPGLAIANDDTRQPQTTCACQQDSVFSLPVVAGPIIAKHDWIALVDGEQSPWDVVAGVERGTAARDNGTRKDN